MPEATAFRVELWASRREARLRVAARVVTAVAAVACGLVALRAPSAGGITAMLAALGAFVLAFVPARAAAARQLVVDADGAISAGAGGVVQPAVVRYFGPHLVCLGTPGGLLTIWPDSLSPALWRRLLVACRWQRRQPADGRQRPSGLRTK